MDGKSLVPGERYLMRIAGKQVPVQFQGRVDAGKPGVTMLMFRRLGAGTMVYKRAAGALSRHYDDCCIGRLFDVRTCNCGMRLRKEAQLWD